MTNPLIKRFKTYIKEAHLTPDQKRGFVSYASSKGVGVDMDAPSDKARKISDHVFGEDNDTIMLPIKTPTMDKIKEHLSNRGYKINYGKKEAYKDTINNRGESQRQTTSITKALTKTKAPQSLIDSFVNGNPVEDEQVSKYKIIISRLPKRICAGSTNTPWDSCAKLNLYGEPYSNGNESGQGDINSTLAAGKLPFHIKHGTHVAYMVPNREDTERNLIKDAVGRTFLNPYTSEDGHTILSPEKKSYTGLYGGDMPQGYKDTLQEFTDNNFPLKINTIYKKNPHLYNDDRTTTRSKIDINQPFPKINTIGDYYIRDIMSDKSVSAKDITDYLTKYQKNDRNDLVHNPRLINYLHHSPNFNKEHISTMLHPRILNELHESAHSHLIKNVTNKIDFEKLFDYHINRNYSSDNMYHIISHTLLTPDHVNRLLDSSHFNNTNNDDYNKANLLRSNKLHGKKLDETVNKALTVYGYNAVAFNPNLSEKHLTTILSNPNVFGDTESVINKHIPKLNADHIHSVIDNNISNDQYSISHQQLSLIGSLSKLPNFNISHLDKLYGKLHSTGREHMEYGLLNNRNTTPEIKDGIADHIIHSGETENIRNLLNNHTLKAEHIHQILDNPKNIYNFFDFGLSRRMLQETNFNDEHLAKLTSPTIYNELDGETRDNILTYLHNTGKTQQFIDNIPNHKESYEPILRGHHSYNLLAHYKNTLTRPEVYNKLHSSDKEKILS